MKTYNDLRHKSRMRLVETLYAKKVNPKTQELPGNVYNFDESLVNIIQNSIDSHLKEIDELIENTSGRKISEIKNIEYIVMVIALAESYYSDITPYKVAIDEAIELSREYSEESSAIFVSGVLGAAFHSKKSNS